MPGAYHEHVDDSVRIQNAEGVDRAEVGAQVAKEPLQREEPVWVAPASEFGQVLLGLVSVGVLLNQEKG